MSIKALHAGFACRAAHHVMPRHGDEDKDKCPYALAGAFLNSDECHEDDLSDIERCHPE